MIQKLFTFGLLVAGLLAVTHSNAEIYLEITKGVSNARPIAVVPFSYQGKSVSPPHDIAAVVSNDLRRSGRFAPMSMTQMPELPRNFTEVTPRLWKEKGIEAVVVGHVKQLADGQYEVTYDLVDVFGDPQTLMVNGRMVTAPPTLLSEQHTASESQFRMHAHRIADEIYEKLTGERGAFYTRIAYVEVDRGSEFPFRLMVADSDGYGAKAIRRSKHPIMSPTWSPDAQQLAYVTFENKRSEIILQNPYTGTTEILASYDGINSAPAFSPDGRRLAMVLSKDGNPEIYVMDIASKRLTRITNHSAIETEPAWAPDGRSLVFTSDRGLRPQIYRYWFGSGDLQRVTFEGDYNASAQFTPDGRKLILVNRTNGVYHIALHDFDIDSLQVLTETHLDESPSLAPNGSMVIYATLFRGRQVLAIVSTDGRFNAHLPERSAEVRAPAWSPYLN